MANKKTKDKYATILSAAVKVMGESGYHGAPISRIAREAGVADGTVYLYFKNKEDILISILRVTIGDIVEQILIQYKRLEDKPIDALHAIVSIYFRTLGSDTNLATVTQVHLRQTDAEMRRKIGEIMRPFQQIIAKTIDRGVEKGVFRETIDRRIARRMIFGTLDETVTAWILSGAKYDLISLIDPVCDVLVNGLKA
nr:TetR/AcrR family transcriptional regulator [Collibacillus ludicampi]